MAISEHVNAVNNVVWAFRKKFYQNGVLNVNIRPRLREYNEETFYTYDIYVYTDDKRMSRIRIAPNFKKNVVNISILNKENLINAIEEGKKLLA